MAHNDHPVPQGRIRRTMPLAGFAARAAGGRLVAGLRQRTGEEGAVEQFHERTAERYTELLGHSKGVLMKAGQILSMVDARALGSGGFWPYQKALARLQADAPPMHPALVQKVLHEELGSAVKLFVEFDDDPIAAASVGQVHRAVLCDGRDVAVKIQYPGVAQAIRDDLANTELLATFMRFVNATSAVKVDVQAVAREAAARILEEIDHRHEAAMIAAFGELYRGHPFIRVPDVVPETSADRILTMTYLDGMDWAAAQQADQDLKNTWAEAILRFSHSNFRHANLLHVDPHPGNYCFNTDGTVGFVDFGCVKVLSEAMRWLIVAMQRALIEGRKHDYRTLMAQAGFLAPDSDLSADELYQWQSQMYYEVIAAPQPATYTAETTARTVRGIFGLRDADHPINRMNAPDDYVFVPRLHLAVFSVCADLGATMPVRAIYEDMDGVTEPNTELGKLHHAWVRERGLPAALDHHDHP
ncbi:AarF/ABC1/UbiB kinase family protein [Mycobacterium sp. 050128]|uniref:ABC1 kinase family protein n=1 Tax=Mycobacterium sp. 050128 TaxID=3096112 RepID=UPI002EDB216E